MARVRLRMHRASEVSPPEAHEKALGAVDAGGEAKALIQAYRRLGYLRWSSRMLDACRLLLPQR